jgi:hypothetical protein
VVVSQYPQTQAVGDKAPKPGFVQVEQLLD